MGIENAAGASGSLCFLFFSFFSYTCNKSWFALETTDTYTHWSVNSERVTDHNVGTAAAVDRMNVDEDATHSSKRLNSGNYCISFTIILCVFSSLYAALRVDQIFIVVNNI
jgi:hypothetical protein